MKHMLSISSSSMWLVVKVLKYIQGKQLQNPDVTDRITVRYVQLKLFVVTIC